MAPACFPRGTLITTPTGKKAIETLKNGDTILTADGREVTIRVISFKINCANKEEAPYCISAGALGEYCPFEDVHLSARHAIQDARGVWQIPKFLAKTNPGVKQYGIGEPVEYFHIECPDFFTDNLSVGGAVVESFKNRQGPSGVVYKWVDELKGFMKNTKDEIHPIPKNVNTIMIYSSYEN